jgi:glycosyltransferase 2 family protein
MSATLKKWLQFIVFIGVGVGVMYLVFRSQNQAFQEQCRLDGVAPDQCSLTDKLWNDFSGTHPLWIAAVVLAFTLSNVFRAIRWQMLLEPLGYQVRFPNSLMTILLGYFANLGFPRMGEVTRAATLARYERIPLQKVMGTMVVDRLMDFVCLAAVMGLAFLLEGGLLLQFISGRESGEPGGSNTLLIALFVTGVLGLVLLYLLRNWLLRFGPVQKIAHVLNGFREGLKSVFQLRSPGLFIALSVGIWLMFYLQCLFNLHAFAPTHHLSWQAALMVFVFGTLGFVIPSPGGMGTYHALCIAALGLYSVSGSDAFSYANIAFFTVQIFYNLIAGCLSLLLLPIYNRRTAAQAPVP